MATVYLARDLKHDRAVALKVLKPELAAAIGPDRFLREIDISARLTHPHILPLLDSGDAAGTPFYTMPYVEGESLRERIAREQQLPLEDALQIAREVGDALGYAHSHGVIHRDIKPANILLEGGHAVVADFGIARAVDVAGMDTLTASGVTLGTPGYMSPEQATAAAALDGRADVYSLGCVLYEMLAGEMPFTGPSAQAVVAKQLSMPVPPVTIVREAVPEEIDGVLARALAKAPADRFRTAGDFVAALDDVARAAPGDPRRRRSAGRRRAIRLGLAFVLVVAAAIAAARVVPLVAGSGGPARDTTRYVVRPFDYTAGAGTALNEVQRMQDALARWTGLTVAPRTPDRRAGREVRGMVTPVGDAVRVHAALYDAGSDTPLANHAVRFVPDRADLDSLFAELADHLLLRGALPAHTPATAGTGSLPARQAFQRGQALLDQWDLAAADSAFMAAVAFDPAFASAHLWLALARAWSGAERASWSVAAEQAALGRSLLPDRERTLSDAIVAQARGDLGGACPRWAHATENAPTDYAAWYGLAWCEIWDVAVVPDERSPSGWRFRTSYHHALNAFQRAFELRPAILASFRARSYESLRNYLMTGTETRGGVAAPPDTGRFGADPMWQGDSLALVPYPIRAERIRALPATYEEAIRHQRLRFRDIALSWAGSTPRSADAQEALAIALAMLGDPAALDTLGRARVLAVDTRERFRVAAAEVWMRLAFALPWNVDEVHRARALADSLLAAAPIEGDPAVIAGLAALLGRAGRAAAAARLPRAADGAAVPAPLRETAPALLIFAALGGPIDSIADLEGRVATAIDETLLPDRRDGERLRWLARAATLAFPVFRFRSLDALAGRGDYLVDLQAAWAAGDTAAVRRGLREVSRARAHARPGGLPLDGLYPEADLLVALGDVEAAAQWLDPTLRGLPQTAPHVLASPVRAAALMRAMALRATIADRLGDRAGAARWATAVTVLWADADPALTPLVRAVRGFVR